MYSDDKLNGRYVGLNTILNEGKELVAQGDESFMKIKIDPEELIVIYDDIDIPTGTFRIRKKGSPGTHNGMRNIFQHIQTNDFPRIRVGIGSGKKENLIGYVTGGISKSEKELLEDALKKSADAAACIIEKGIDKAMNEYNVRPNKEKKEKKAVEEEATKND